MIGFEEIAHAFRAQLAAKFLGADSADYDRALGLDPDAVAHAAREAAEEEFAVLPGLPRGVNATGRLRGLSRSQREAAREALEETFTIALRAGVLLERQRQERES